MSREVTERERIAYRQGYINCCLNHGLPYVSIEPDKWTDKAVLEVHVGDLWIEQLIKRGNVEAYAADIAKRLVAEYQEYKKNQYEIQKETSSD